MDVHPDRGRGVGGPLGQDRVDDEQAAVRGHPPAAHGEDASAVCVVPVVEDPRQQVGVRAGGTSSKKSPATHAPAPHTPAASRCACAAGIDRRAVQQGADAPGACRGGEEHPVPPAYVDERCRPPKS